MLGELQPTLNAVGISVTLSLVPWDATSPDTTAKLVDEWFGNSTGAGEYLAIVANFSGEGANKFKAFERSFQHMEGRLYDKKCTMMWVEPRTPGGKDFLNNIRRVFSFWKSSAQSSCDYSHDYEWYHPLQKRKLPCTVLVQRYKRS